MKDTVPTSTPVSGSGHPHLSVIMAAYNRERFIVPALTSILDQDYAPLEIIVIDDGSTDGTPGLVRDLAARARAPIRYVRQENAGLSTAHNHGLRLASGKVITFLDSDDLWPAERLPGGIDQLVLDPGLPGPGMILSQAHRFSDGARVNPEEMAAANNRPFHYTLGASLIARWVFDTLGPFDENLPYSADWDWFVRAKDAGIPFQVDPRVNLRVRVHGSNMTRERSRIANNTTRLLHKHLERLRARPASGEGDD